MKQSNGTVSNGATAHLFPTLYSVDIMLVARHQLYGDVYTIESVLQSSAIMQTRLFPVPEPVTHLPAH